MTVHDSRHLPEVVMTLLVRDEEDVIESNLDYHLSMGVSFVVATDNGSVDATPEILGRYEQLGVLHLIHEPVQDFSQHRWVTGMARLASSQFGADWVINNDADEFWVPAASSLPEALATVPPEVDVVVAHRHNMVADRDRPGGPELCCFRHRRSVNLAGGDLGPKVIHRADPAIIVRQGNHEVERPGPGGTLDDGRIEILHYPVRDRQQLERSLRNVGESYRANTELPYEVGHVQREIYERCKEDGFDRLWHEQTATGDEITAGVADGRFVEDRRVLDRLLELAAGET